MSTVAPDTSLKRRRPARHPVAQGQDKKRKKEQCVAKGAAAAAWLKVRHVGIPLVCKATGCPCESIRPEAGRLYAIGRGAGRCDFLLPDLGSATSIAASCSTVASAGSSFSREKFGEESEAAPCGTLSRVFVNGVECRQGSVVLLFAGDEVLLVCGGDGKCVGTKRMTINFGNLE